MKDWGFEVQGAKFWFGVLSIEGELKRFFAYMKRVFFCFLMRRKIFDLRFEFNFWVSNWFKKFGYLLLEKTLRNFLPCNFTFLGQSWVFKGQQLITEGSKYQVSTSTEHDLTFEGLVFLVKENVIKPFLIDFPKRFFSWLTKKY